MRDPNVDLASQQFGDVRQQRKDWELDVDYSDLSSLTSALPKLSPMYGNVRALNNALHDDADKVAANARLPEHVVRTWWIGATDWLVAGRTASSNNLYQRADIKGPRHAKRLGDFWVRRRLEKVRLSHPETTIPEPLSRALMASTAKPPAIR